MELRFAASIGLPLMLGVPSGGDQQAGTLRAAIGDDRVTLNYETRDREGRWRPRRQDLGLACTTLKVGSPVHLVPVPGLRSAPRGPLFPARRVRMPHVPGACLSIAAGEPAKSQAAPDRGAHRRAGREQRAIGRNAAKVLMISATLTPKQNRLVVLLLEIGTRPRPTGAPTIARACR